MKNNFLQYFLQDILSKGIPLEETHLILPGKRPEIFIKKELLHMGYHGFLPRFYSLEEWAQKLAQKQLITGLPLWIEAFHIFKNIEPQISFEDFLKWIPTVLKDFNELDIYTENPEFVLRYMVEAERIENFGVESYESSGLLLENKNFWKKLHPFYVQLQNHLESRNWATSGRMLALAQSHAKSYLQQHPTEYFVFAGFNALSRVEQFMFKELAQSSKTHFYWDIDRYYYDNPIQEAGNFLREYAQKYPEFSIDKHIFSEWEKPKKIQSLASPKKVWQALYVSQALEKLTEEELQNTALVLCDENNLNSVLNHLPKNVQNVNITMGYPLSKNALNPLLEIAILLQKKTSETGKISVRLLLDFLQSLQIFPTEEIEKTEEWILSLISSKKLYIQPEEVLSQNFSFIPLIQPYDSVEDWMVAAQKYAEKQQKVDTASLLQKAVWQKIGEVFSELLNPQFISILNWNILPQVYKQLIKNQQIDFLGQPLAGLQIMGLLETRLLHFDRLFFMDVNEGVLPLGRTQNSFIPFDVKRKFGIQTFLENDSVYAYHFLRLLQCSKEVVLLYNSVSEGLQSGEKSRFITQLEIESTFSIQEAQLKLSDLPVDYQSEKNIYKTEIIENEIRSWLSKNKISASAINSYLYNPVNFFEQYILGIRNPEEYEDSFTVLSLGNVLHRTLELLYSPFISTAAGKGLPYTIANLEALFPQIETFFNQAVTEKNIPLEWFAQGSNLLEKQIAKRMVENLLLNDLDELKTGKVIEILELEKHLEFQYEHPSLGSIHFQGYIDRIDRCDGILRVLDYKSGGAKDLRSFNRNGLIIPDYKSSQLIQLMLYAQMIFQNYDTQNLQCGIYSLKNSKNGISYLNLNGSEIVDRNNLAESFVLVEDILSEMVNPDIPLLETPIISY